MFVCSCDCMCANAAPVHPLLLPLQVAEWGQGSPTLVTPMLDAAKALIIASTVPPQAVPGGPAPVPAKPNKPLSGKAIAAIVPSLKILATSELFAVQRSAISVLEELVSRYKAAGVWWLWCVLVSAGARVLTCLWRWVVVGAVVWFALVCTCRCAVTYTRVCACACA